MRSVECFSDAAIVIGLGFVGEVADEVVERGHEEDAEQRLASPKTLCRADQSS